jgi:hypothetical protein
MRVGQRKRRQESNGLAAWLTNPAPNLNPVMAFIVSLFPTKSMANYGISRAQWAAAYNLRSRRPIRFQLAMRYGK